jgi:Raf kinase inhibitor-like YbhB/YbcL family protein
MARGILAAVLGIVLSVACQSAEEAEQKHTGEIAMTITLESTAFEAGETIPTKHTCDGDDVSPPLSWGEVPEGSESIALICDDPDAPRGTWVHWVVFGLPPDTRQLPEGIPADPALQDGAVHGTNDFGRSGYGGPCPPAGPAHRYYFRLYALDSELQLDPGASKQDLVAAMEGHILGEGELMGRYGR